MAYYADAAAYEAFVEDGTVDWTTTSEPDLEKLLTAAERDVDGYLAPWWGDLEENGRLFGSPKTTNEKDLTPQQVRELSDLTCARAEYRAMLGSEFFVRAQYEIVGGPDFNTTGKLDPVGPKTRVLLRRTSLTRRPTVW